MDNIPDEFRQRNYPKGYNSWHWENLPRYCLMIDIDSIEIRRNEIVAIIETRSTPTPLNDWHKEKILKVANALNIPAYLVYFNQDDMTFTRTNLRTEEQITLSEIEYKFWLMHLWKKYVTQTN